MLIRLHIPGFVGPNAIHLFSDYPRIACYPGKQFFLGRRFRANPTQIVTLDELKAGGFLARNKGSDDKWFLQDECFSDKACHCFTSYHIRSCHIGSDCFSKRQGSYLRNARVTRCHALVIADCQNNLHGYACAQQALDSLVNSGGPLCASLKKDSKYSRIKIQGLERFIPRV